MLAWIFFHHFTFGMNVSSYDSWWMYSPRCKGYQRFRKGGGGINRVFISLLPIVPKIVEKVSIALKKGAISGPLPILAVPLLIWSVQI